MKTVIALAERGNGEALQTLASWQVASESVQVAARRACAAVLRKPAGNPRRVTVVGTQEAATVDLLLTLLDADELVEIDPAQLGPQVAQPAGGVMYAISEWSSADEPGHPEQPSFIPAPPAPAIPDDGPDAVALVAAGPPGDLLVAIARQLTALAEDRYDNGESRSRSVQALRRLVDRLPADLAGEVSQRLYRLHQRPELNEGDLWEIETDTPFSRSRMTTGARSLGAWALLTSAEAFRAGRLEREYVDQVLAWAAQLLRSDEAAARNLGAGTVAAIASSAEELKPEAAGLLYHPDDGVRARGAAIAPASDQMFRVLAKDPAATVRAALASRLPEVPEDIRNALTEDSNFAVRRRATSKRGPSSSLT